MAAVGVGKLTEKSGIRQSDEPPQAFDLPAANLIVNPVQMHPVTTVGTVPVTPGSPIMREDFITGTGVQLHSTSSL